MKRHSLSVRVNFLILLLVVVSSGSLVTAAYLNNSRQVDEFYSTRASQTAATFAVLIDGDEVREILNIFQTEEYQALRAEAEEAEDEARIKAYLDEKGISDEIERLSTLLNE